jgi:hypothetical protein
VARYPEKEVGITLDGSVDRYAAALDGFASDRLAVLEHLVDVDEGVGVLVGFLLKVHGLLLETSVLI